MGVGPALRHGARVAASDFRTLPRAINSFVWRIALFYVGAILVILAIGIYLLAVTAVVLTHVPGGVGVFELVVLTMLDPAHPDQVMGSLIAFRVVQGLGASMIWTSGSPRSPATSGAVSPAIAVASIDTMSGAGLGNASPMKNHETRTTPVSIARVGTGLCVQERPWSLLRQRCSCTSCMSTPR